MTRGMPETQEPDRCRPAKCYFCQLLPIFVLTLALCLGSNAIVEASAPRPMKIHLQYDHQVSEILSSDLVLFLRQSLEVIADEVGHLLRVTETMQKLKLKTELRRKNSCTSKLSSFPKADPKVWIEADFIAFVQVRSCSEEIFWAESFPCHYQKRPVSGLLSFCAKVLAVKDLRLLIAVSLRHLFSLLGFHHQLMTQKDCILRTADTNRCWHGTNESTSLPSLVVTSPHVLSFSKIFTGNPSCPGLPLSAHGTAWDSFLMFTSILADSPISPSIAPWLSMDKATLGLMADLGWYHVHGFESADPMLWGRGAGKLLTSCDDSCKTGVCNKTEAECFQLGARADHCIVCQNLRKLRLLETNVCAVEQCSAATRSYRLMCFVGMKIRTFNCSNHRVTSSMCLSYFSACSTARAPTFVTKLARKMKRTSTAPPPVTTTVPSGFRFSLRFQHLDYVKVATKYRSEIKSQFTQTMSTVFGITDRPIVRIINIVKGSTIIHFTVYNLNYPVKKIYILLKKALVDKVIVLKLEGQSYFPTDMESHDYEAPRSYLTEIIVGSTLGLVFTIGIVSVVVIIIVKKTKQPPNTIYPCPEASSDGDSIYCRSNSLQTVSVASYAAVYELRRERSSNPRPTSLRNVTVSPLSPASYRNVSPPEGSSHF